MPWSLTYIGEASVLLVEDVMEPFDTAMPKVGN